MTDNIGRAELREYAERTSRLMDERDAIVGDIKEIAAEVKSRGYSTKAFNAALKLHRMTGEQREQYELFSEETSLYLDAMDGKE